MGYAGGRVSGDHNHHRAHAARMGSTLGDAGRGRGSPDVRQHRPRAARRARARASHAAVEHRSRPSAPTGRPLANRAPSMPERRADDEALGALLDAVHPIAVVPVGRIAERALADLSVAACQGAASSSRRRDAVPRAGGRRARDFSIRTRSVRVRGVVGPRIADRLAAGQASEHERRPRWTRAARSRA